MNCFIDRLTLLFYCTLNLLFSEPNTAFVIALFAAVTISALAFFFEATVYQQLPPAFYCALALFFPQFCCFLPLICYDLSITDLTKREAPLRKTHSDPKETFLCIAALLLALSSLLRFFWGQPRFWLLLMGMFLALLLRRRTEKYETLYRSYLKTRDDDTELQLLLEEKNHTLREKQDSEIYTATLRERNRIAREIHDNVGHMLTRSILMVGALKAVNQMGTLHEPLCQLDDTLNQAMNSIRQSVHDLHDSSINLQDSLQALIRDFTFCPVALQYDMSPGVPREIKYSFISIAKEALVNISRHSNATKACITAVEHPGLYQFIIEDNGTSQRTGDVKIGDLPAPSGIGLTNIQSRVQSLHGHLQIRQKDGFRIHITIPKENTYEFITDRR